MDRDPVLAARTLPIGTDDNRVPMVFRVEGGLHYIRGNDAPYFSLAYTAHRKGFPNQCYSGGAGHDAIRRHYGDRFDDLAALHLSSIDGVPMHAESNGWYWLCGALPGGGGATYHAGNGKRQHWLSDGSFDGYRESSAAECLEVLARHLRIAPAEARKLRDEAIAEHDANPDGWSAARETFALRVNDMRPRWKAEADAAIARYALRVYGDPWPTR